jgi:6-phosphogluconolactonase
VTPHDRLELPPGSGPRHFAFHPSLPFAYVVNELASTVASLAYDASAGTLGLLGTEVTVAPEAMGHSHCSAIKIAPGGRHLFVGNRGENTIARFDIDQSTGLARRAAATPAGKTPRDFDFAPTGTYLAVANQDSDSVSLLSYDPVSGGLTFFGEPIATGTPTAIAWARAAD